MRIISVSPFVVTGVAALHFILVVLYFPSKPAHPPSKTASIERVDYKQGMASLVRYALYYILCTCYRYTCNNLTQ